MTSANPRTTGSATTATDQPIPLARPNITDEERARVADVLNSHQLSGGSYLEAFEQKMAERCRTEHAVAVSSGTGALHCIVSALDLEPGSEVLTTPFSFIASSNVLLYENLRPRFVDIDPETYNLDVARASAAVTSKTKAVLAVDVFGQPADWPALTNLADSEDLILIDDACEALGASVENRPVGSWGRAAAFGFYPNKQITTGEGGCITTDDAELARRCHSLRNQGRPESGEMAHVRLGYNYRLDEMSAALGCAQLDRLDDLLDQRSAVAEMYREVLSPLAGDLVLPQQTSTKKRSWFVYVVRLRNHFGDYARDRLIDRLQAEGIGCAPYFPSIHLQPVYRDRFGFSSDDFPVCERVAARTFALPFHDALTRNEIDRVADVLTEILPSLPRQS